MTRDSSDDPIEVRNRFDGRWSAGYRLDAIVTVARRRCFRVRRSSDGSLLPGLFDSTEIRRVGAPSVDWRSGSAARRPERRASYLPE